MSASISKQRNSASVSNGCTKKRRATHKGSSLLSAEENSKLFEVLGRDRISLVAGVAQLLDAPPESPNVWRKSSVGIVYLVRDYQERNHQLCMYDIFKKELQWFQILYKNFSVICSPGCPRLVAFECDTCVKALNFSDFNEAEEFKVAVEKRKNANQKGHQGRRGSAGTGGFTNQHKSPPYPSQTNSPQISLPSPQLQNGTQSSHYQQQHPVGITNMGVMPHFGFNHLSTKKTTKKRREEKKRKLTKDDIGKPSDFVHKSHVGWDGNSLSTIGEPPFDENFLSTCRAINKDPAKMDQDELSFAYKKYNEYKYKQQNENVGDNAHAQIGHCQFISASTPLTAPRHQPPPRPPPVATSSVYPMNEFRHQHQQQATIMAYSPVIETGPTVPPLPQRALGASLGGEVQQRTQPSIGHHPQVMPNRGKPPPPPPTPPTVLQQQKEQLPSAPIENCPAAPPPPPPPPPLQSKPSLSDSPQPSTSTELSKPPVDARANLLQQIQQGTKLRKVGLPSADRTPVATNPPTLRDNMMEQIKQGTTLKHVDQAETENNRRSAGGGIQEIGGLAGALARALEERRKNIMNSEDSSESDSETNNDEWEDDQE